MQVGGRGRRVPRGAARGVGAAVDAGIRVLAINDDVDTADHERWEERLTEALNHHARTNRYISQRIKRKHEALWEMGAVIGLLKPGYKRRASFPERMGEPAKGPFFDEIDPEWAPVIHEAYERIARGDLKSALLHARLVHCELKNLRFHIIF